MINVLLPLPETPVIEVSVPSGICRLHVFQVVAGGTAQFQKEPVAFTASLRNLDLLRAG